MRTSFTESDLQKIQKALAHCMSEEDYYSPLERKELDELLDKVTREKFRVAYGER